MSKIIVDQRFAPALLKWLDERCPGVAKLEGTQYLLAFVKPQEDDIAREEDILCVCALNRFTEHTCEATLATNGSKQSKANREFIWTIFNYVFNVAGLSRFNTIVSVDNEKSIAVQHMLGLTVDCVLKDQLGEGKDAYLFSLTKREWLAGKWATKEAVS